MTNIKSIDGLPVFDAKRAVVLHVKPIDIRNADPKVPATCAAARAICREMHALEAHVHLSRVYIKTNKGSWTRYITPKSMRGELIAFDRGGAFEPGEFQLCAPQPTKQLGRGGGGRSKKKLGKKDTPRAAQRAAVKNVRTGPA